MLILGIGLLTDQFFCGTLIFSGLLSTVSGCQLYEELFGVQPLQINSVALWAGLCLLGILYLLLAPRVLKLFKPDMSVCPIS